MISCAVLPVACCVVQGATLEVLCDKLRGATCSVELSDKSPAVRLVPAVR